MPVQPQMFTLEQLLSISGLRLREVQDQKVLSASTWQYALEPGHAEPAGKQKLCPFWVNQSHG